MPRLPSYAQHRRAIDWGASVEHPFVCLWGCKDNSGHWDIYDEYWNNSQKNTLYDHFRNIVSRHAWPNDPYHGVTFGDPSGLDRIRIFNSYAACPMCFGQVIAATKGEHDKTACQQCEWTGYKRELVGINVVPAKNAVFEGIECVRRHLKDDANGKPLLQIDKSRCPHLAREMSTYRWMKSSGKGVNPQVAKPQPLKANDDCVDTLRYMVYSDWAPTGGQILTMRSMAPVKKAVQYKRRERR